MSTSLSAAALPAMVRSAFPELAFTHTEIPGQGLDHAVVLLHGTAHGTLVARAPHTAEYRAQAEVEAAVLAEVSTLTDVVLPEPVRTTGDGTLTVHTLVPGSPLVDTALAGAAENREVVNRQLGELLTALHTRDVTTAPFSAVEPWRRRGRCNTAPRSLPAKVALLRERAQRLLPGALDQASLTDVERIFTDMDTLLDPARPARLIHSDLYDEHLLWDPERERLGVIDFSDMNLGDPAVDFAHLPDPHGVLAHYRAGVDDDLLARAAIYRRWDAVYLLVDHLRTDRTPGDLAWSGFAAARAELAE